MKPYEQMVKTVILSHFAQAPRFIKHIAIGICNEVYAVGIKDTEVIVRLSSADKYLMGSRDHIPQLKKLGINVPDILAQDYSRTMIPLAYQIQSKIEGQDLGVVITALTDVQLRVLAKEIVTIFNKIKTIAPIDNKFGIIGGGGENEISDSWTQRMRIWIDESIARGKQTGVIDDVIMALLEKLYATYKSYFDSVKPITYFGDISSKNVMIDNAVLSGLVDLDGLTQGDSLEAIGRIKLSWYGTHYGVFYTNAIMDGMNFGQKQRKLVTMYALLNQISWMCENGIQFNQNTQSIVNKSKAHKNKAIIKALAAELRLL